MNSPAVHVIPRALWPRTNYTDTVTAPANGKIIELLNQYPYRSIVAAVSIFWATHFLIIAPYEHIASSSILEVYTKTTAIWF